MPDETTKLGLSITPSRQCATCRCGLWSVHGKWVDKEGLTRQYGHEHAPKPKFEVGGHTWSSWFVREVGRVRPVVWVGNDRKQSGDWRDHSLAVAEHLAARLNAGETLEQLVKELAPDGRYGVLAVEVPIGYRGEKRKSLPQPLDFNTTERY